MPEFNQLPVMDELAGNDVIPCVDTSDGQTLKQLPVSLLKEDTPSNPSGPLQVGQAPPTSTSALIWLQTDSQGRLIEAWQRSTDGARWISRETYRFRTFRQGGAPLTLQAGVDVPSELIYIDSMYVSGVARSEFRAGKKIKISLSLIDNAPAESPFVSYDLEGLAAEERVNLNLPIHVIKPASEMLAFCLGASKVNNPPKLFFLTLALTLRKVYGTEV